MIGKSATKMIQLRQLTLVLLCTIVAFLFLSASSPVLDATNAGPTPRPIQSQTQTERHALTAEEKRGKAFYLRGESASGQEITALMGDIDVPATTLTSAGCRGARGKGKTEGGVTAGALTWPYLTKPYGHNDDGGRKHPAFSEASFIRMLTSGLDPAGNKLAVAMPTYRMPHQDMADLIAYLKRIETDFDPGVSETNIVIGTLLPDKSALTGLAQSLG